MASLTSLFASSSAEPSSASATFILYLTPAMNAITAPTTKEISPQVISARVGLLILSLLYFQ